MSELSDEVYATKTVRHRLATDHQISQIAPKGHERTVVPYL